MSDKLAERLKGLLDSGHFRGSSYTYDRETIETAIEELEARDRWISVDERLPEEEDEILATAWRYDDPDRGRFFVMAYRCGDLWFEVDGAEMYTPTHWKALTPPENKK